MQSIDTAVRQDDLWEVTECRSRPLQLHVARTAVYF